LARVSRSIPREVVEMMHERAAQMTKDEPECCLEHLLECW
jgi:hypothetical protein